MNNAARVAVLQRFGYLDADVKHLAKGERPFTFEPTQVCTLDDGHDKKERSFVLARIEDWHNGRMVHLSNQLRLALKALFSFRIKQRWRKDRKSTRLNSSHITISYAVFCL